VRDRCWRLREARKDGATAGLAVTQVLMRETCSGGLKLATFDHLRLVVSARLFVCLRYKKPILFMPLLGFPVTHSLQLAYLSRYVIKVIREITGGTLGLRRPKAQPDLTLGF
jgi:hypothetical protein